ncbi:MAG TPA: class I SAM-dependent methyltransferase [Acetobacteraceae bacterium]|nr:class I SAM-dependent methyltransferase [Acetobacteraceae bacterium]
MARWNEGYVADVTYTSQFYREMTPAWLGTAAVLLGHRPPDLARPFRWAELGCGNGFTAAVVAAACPQAEVWAFDFNPAHIETARLLVSRAGLGNINYREASFAELAEAPEGALPEFDFIVAHGVYSWIAPEHRRQVVSFVRQRLRPGGLFYNSYNDAVGWASMVPLRELMRLVTSGNRDRSDLGMTQVAALIDRLTEGQARFFAANPAIESRLKMLRTHDARYLAHEYLNEHWHPQMAADVMAEMAEAKCGFIGSATLTDNIDATSIPPGMRPLMNETQDVALRETLRDFAGSQSFRRDIYRRGVTGLATGEHLDMLDALTLAAIAKPTLDEAGIEFTCQLGTVSGERKLYGSLIDALASGPLTLREARAMPGWAGKPLTELLQAFALLISGGFAHPVMPGGATGEGIAACRALNRAIARMNADGTSVANLVSPVIGSAIPASLTDTLIAGELLEGREARPEQLADRLVAILARTGRQMQKDGAAVTDPGEVHRLTAERVDATLGSGAALHRALAIVG